MPRLKAGDEYICMFCGEHVDPDNVEHQTECPYRCPSCDMGVIQSMNDGPPKCDLCGHRID